MLKNLKADNIYIVCGHTDMRGTTCHHRDLCVVLLITEVTTMLSEETRRKLREMNFGELVEALDLQEKQPECLTLTFDERLNLAVDYTYSAKYNAKVHRLISAAKFRIAVLQMRHL